MTSRALKSSRFNLQTKRRYGLKIAPSPNYKLYTKLSKSQLFYNGQKDEIVCHVYMPAGPALAFGGPRDGTFHQRTFRQWTFG